MSALPAYKGYPGTVRFDAEAGILHGEVLHLKDVVTFQGETVEQVVQAFRDSVDDYLVFCAERGEEPDKPYSGRFVLRVEPEVHRRLATQAANAGKSLNAYVAEKLQA
ncbi:MAG: HicB family protein [Puniceicoccaceae bacterium 5H]|nr:MAG: HicB family protein [Puniceicoccaceae bacterium 5H]